MALLLLTESQHLLFLLPDTASFLLATSDLPSRCLRELAATYSGLDGQQAQLPKVNSLLLPRPVIQLLKASFVDIFFTFSIRHSNAFLLSFL
jgi:hypothetical protein